MPMGMQPSPHQSMMKTETTQCGQGVPLTYDHAVGIRSSALFAIASEWRRDAEMHRNSCRLQEQADRRDKADRHYQRSLDLDACAKRIEDLANAPAMPTASDRRPLT